MLTLKAFDADTLPAWTEDRDTFLMWATYPQEAGRPPMAPRSRIPLTPPGMEESHAKYLAPKEASTSPYLVWHASTADAYFFGWGTYRIVLEAPQGSFPSFRADAYCPDKGWTVFGIDPFERIQKDLAHYLNCANARKDLAETPAHFFDDSFVTEYRFDIPPWSVERLFMTPSSHPYRVEENGAGAEQYSDAISSAQRPHFLRWLAHRWRGAVKKFPELKYVVAALQLQHTRTRGESDPAAQFTVLWANIRANHSWTHYPFDWLTYALHRNKSRPFAGRETWAYNFCAKNHWFNIAYLYSTDFYLGVGAMRLALSKRSARHVEQLSLKESLRFLQTVAKIPTKDWPKTCPAALLDVLLLNKKRIPSEERLRAAMDSAHVEHAWMSRLPQWSTSSFAWPKHVLEGIGDGNRTYFLENLRKHHRRFIKSPQHSTFMNQATLAWLDSPLRRNGKTRAETLEEDKQALSDLMHVDLSAVPPHVLKERINKNSSWNSFLRLLAYLRQEKLRITTDFTAPPVFTNAPTPAAPFSIHGGNDEADPSWPTALGMLNIGSIKVFPLCRQSHLGTVGEVLENCTAPGRSLGGFVSEALEGGQRYFRLEKEDKHCLLQINRKSDGEWKVSTVLGRLNHTAPEEISSAAKRVAELYTLLSNQADGDTFDAMVSEQREQYKQKQQAENADEDYLIENLQDLIDTDNEDNDI